MGGSNHGRRLRGEASSVEHVCVTEESSADRRLNWGGGADGEIERKKGGEEERLVSGQRVPPSRLKILSEHFGSGGSGR